MRFNIIYRFIIVAVGFLIIYLFALMVRYSSDHDKDSKELIESKK